MEIIATVLYYLSWIVFWATIAFAGLFVLRVLLNWAGTNPFGRVPYHLTRITEPMVRPIRYQFGRGHMRYDLIPLVMGVMILVTGLFLSSIIWQFAIILVNIAALLANQAAPARPLIGELIHLLGLLYIVAIFLRFFLPLFGVGYMNKFFRFVFVITEPLLKPLRRIFVYGTFDFSPFIAMLIVQLLTGFFASLIIRGGM